MTQNKEKPKGFTEEERRAIQERVRELRSGKVNGESILLEKIEQMPPADRVIAEKLHALIKKVAPQLSPKSWYGMPAYANKDGKVVCFFTPASKFKERYSTFGFQPTANLDEANMWPTSFALKKLTPKEEERIAALVKKAVS